MPDYAQLDKKYLWHPFTQMRDWLRGDPIVISSGKGAVLRDTQGREYLDANSSIWTNLHGHNQPAINSAIRSQLRKIAHSSALGFANEPASVLAQRLIDSAVLPAHSIRPAKNSAAVIPPQNPRAELRNPQLKKVFFSDDGSTAMEVALKLAYVHARRVDHIPHPKFLSLQGAYHGDTAGAVSLGHIDLFHKTFAGLLFKSDRVMAPYCYRCPFNRAKPERADAREYRRCNFECVDVVEQKFSAQKKRRNQYAGFVFEPLMQGAAGMIPQPSGWLRRVAEIARSHKTQLIADEVMTGFGRTGTEKSAARTPRCEIPLACHQEGVQPDFVALAKGLTGGYLPMAATLTTQAVFDSFLGDYGEFKTFFHGHSFTGNQLGAAAALASLDLLQSRNSIQARQKLEISLHAELAELWCLSSIGDIRQVGLVAGIELVREWRTRQSFGLHEQAGIRVCEAMAKRGVLTRPIGNVIVLMPPYCASAAQVRCMAQALAESIEEVLQ